MELIDKQKLLEWLKRNIEANQLSQGGIALKILREKVEFGTFDAARMPNIDRERLLSRMNDIRNQHLDDEEGNITANDAVVDWFEIVIDEIESGTFDDHSAQDRLIQAEQEKRDLMVSQLEADRIIEKAWAERNALLEGLKWYADGNNWGSIEELGAMVSDGGDHARSIIAKIEP